MNTPQKIMRRSASTPVSASASARLLRTDESTVVWIKNKKTGAQNLLELRRGTVTWPSFPESDPQRMWATEEEWRASVKPVPSAPKKPKPVTLRVEGSTVVWCHETGVLLELRRGDLTWPSFPKSEPQRTWATEEEWRAAVAPVVPVVPVAPVVPAPVDGSTRWEVRRGNHLWFFDSYEDAREFSDKPGPVAASLMPVRILPTYLTLRSGKKVYHK